MSLKTLVAVLAVLLEGDTLISTTKSERETTFEMVGYTVTIRPRVWTTNMNVITGTNVFGNMTITNVVWTNFVPRVRTNWITPEMLDAVSREASRE